MKTMGNLHSFWKFSQEIELSKLQDVDLYNYYAMCSNGLMEAISEIYSRGTTPEDLSEKLRSVE